MTTVSSSTSANTTQASTDRTALSNDFDDFLLLLTTQLQNQDPLSPMDSNEFTSQLVQFSSVEQSIKGNEYLENLLTMQSLNLTALGLSFIGKDVEVAGDAFITDGGEVQMSYVMPDNASSGTIVVKDEDGNTVFSKSADLTSGRHDFIWDGKTSSGTEAPAGNYSVSVSALNAENTSLNVITYVPGRVESLVSADDGSLMLVINGEQVPMTDVRKVSQPGS